MSIKSNKNELVKCQQVAKERILSYAKLKRGWYGGDEKPFSKEVISRALEILNFVKIPYEVFPTFSGEIQFETESKKDDYENPDIELDIDTNSVECFWVFDFKKDDKDATFSDFYRDFSIKGKDDLEKAADFMNKWSHVSAKTYADYEKIKDLI